MNKFLQPTVTNGGNVILPIEKLSTEMLENKREMIVSSTQNASIYIIQSQSKESRVIVCDTEDEVDQMLNDGPMKNALLNTEDKEGSNNGIYVFETKDIMELLSYDDKEVLDLLTETMELFDSINPKEFIKKVIELKEVYNITYIFNRMMNMSRQEMDNLMNARNTVCWFKDLVCSCEDVMDDNEPEESTNYLEDLETEDDGMHEERIIPKKDDENN